MAGLILQCKVVSRAFGVVTRMFAQCFPCSRTIISRVCCLTTRVFLLCCRCITCLDELICRVVMDFADCCNALVCSDGCFELAKLCVEGNFTRCNYSLLFGSYVLLTV
jgi:hypothetical protein